MLKDSDIKVGSVVGFPLGFEDTESKVKETEELIKKGADEIEVVMNLSYLKDEKYSLLEEEIMQLRKAAGDKVLKVIMESKALEDYQKANAANNTARGDEYVAKSLPHALTKRAERPRVKDETAKVKRHIIVWVA